MKINSQELDNFITGHYGEDQFRDDGPPEVDEVAEDSLPECDYCPSKLYTEQEQSKRLCKWCQQ